MPILVSEWYSWQITSFVSLGRDSATAKIPRYRCFESLDWPIPVAALAFGELQLGLNAHRVFAYCVCSLDRISLHTGLDV